MFWKINILFLFVVCSFGVRAKSMFVYYPTEVSVSAIEDSMLAVCPDMDITVFGRSKDFRKEIIKNPPIGIVTLQPVVDSLAHFTLLAKGVFNDKTEHEYVLVSIDTPIDLALLEKEKIGVIDLLGRKPMSKYVDSLLGEKIKLKRVTKVEDLLPLLTFGSVKGIFISKVLFQSIQSKSNLDLVSVPLNINVGLASVATSSSEFNAKVNKCVNNFDDNVNQMLGVQQWRTL